MKVLTTAAATAALLVAGLVLPAAANASIHPTATHHRPSAVKNAPCGSNGLGIDLALGTFNLCLPL
jgi:hypothetical protein